MEYSEGHRVLVIDDMTSIHEDFRVIFAGGATAKPTQLEQSLFDAPPQETATHFEIAFAHQGQQGVVLAQSALEKNEPVSVACVDMRMPPGWDGLRTIEELWRVDPRLQVIICTAYSEHAWDVALARLRARGRLLVIKKPFDAVEVRQAVETLSAKWAEARQAEARLEETQRALQQCIQARRSPPNGMSPR